MSRDKGKDSIFEILDDIIYHLNTSKRIFSILILSAFILAPITLILAGIIAGHPKLLFFIINREPEVVFIVILHIIVTIMMSILWLAIGIKEYAFFNRWEERFKRFMEKRERVDKELLKDDDSSKDG